MTPPLDAIVCFPAALPPADSLAPGAPPRFDAYAVAAPSALLVTALADLDQPLAPGERVVAASARSALHLTCSADAPALARVEALLARLDLLFAAGAVVAVLPAALRFVGASLLARTRALPPGERALAVCVHRHAAREGDRIWLHTHGLEQLALPDLACTATRAELADAQQVIDTAIDRAVLEGAPLAAGERIEAAWGERRVWFDVERAAPRADHPYGAYGALALAIIPSCP